jgi:U3 small nucleolar RNA-associated protein 5
MSRRLIGGSNDNFQSRSGEQVAPAELPIRKDNDQNDYLNYAINMSVAKRSRSGQSVAASYPASPLPASKRQKVSQDGRSPAKVNGLKFLVDENARAGTHLTAESTNGLAITRAPAVNHSRTKVTPNHVDDDLGDSTQQYHHTQSAFGPGSVASDGVDPSSDEDVNGATPVKKIELAAARRVARSENATALNAYDTASPNGKIARPRSRSNGDARGNHTDTVRDSTAEPAFGELLLAQNADAIDVTDSADHARDGQLVHVSGEPNLVGLSSATLGTVLTQALKTNDKERLETCFAIAESDRIRATIQRLHSEQAATLLLRISERIFSRPGRAGNFLLWTQWSLAIHGQYLAAHEGLMPKLNALRRVVKERARGLQPLLHLKGKIELLTTQMEMRHQAHRRAAALNADDQDNEDNVIYVEGQDDWSDDDVAEPSELRTRAWAKLARLAREQAESDDESEPHLLTNGDVSGHFGSDEDDDDVEGDDDDGDDDESQGMLDIEADESSDDDGSDGSEEDGSDGHDEEGFSDEEDDVSDDGVKPPRLQTLNRRR